MVSGQVERLSKPKLEPEGQIVRAMLQREGRVARQMRQDKSDAARHAFAAQNSDPKSKPFGLCPAIISVHDAGGAGIIGLMHDRVLAMENPVIRVCPLDPNAGLVAGDNLGGARMAFAFSASISNRACERMNMFISAPSLTIKPESVAEHAAQPLVGQRLEALEINRQRMNARPKRRRRRDRGRRSFRLAPQCAHRQAKRRWRMT